MGFEKARIDQTSPITNKLIILYGEGGPAISPSHTLVLDATVRYKVMVKNFTPEDVHTFFNDRNTVEQKLVRARNITNKEEIMKISPILPYWIYDGFEKYLDAAMVYESLMDSLETSYMHFHGLNFKHSWIIVKYRLNNAKPFLPQSQLFAMLPPDARRWAYSRFIQIFPTQHVGMAGQKFHTPTGPQKMPKCT